MFDIEINNFQSIRHAKFSVKGLTVLVGDNDIGKSSTYRSIHGLFNNRSGNGFITQGESDARVSITYEGRTITWNKNKKTSSYSYSSQGKTENFDKVGRSAPEFITELGFGALDLKAGKLNPHFSGQREDPFLLGKSGSKQMLTEFFSELLKFGPLGKAIGNVTKEMRNLTKIMTAQEEQCKAHDHVLQKFPDLDPIAQAHNTIQLLVDQHATLTRQISLMSEFLSMNQTTQEVPNMSSDLSESIKTLEQTRMNHRLVDAYQTFKDNCSIDVPDPDISRISQLEYARLNILVHRYEIPDIKPPSFLEVDYILSVHLEKKSEAAVLQADEKVQEHKETFHTQMKELGACPLCEQVIS